MRSVVELAAEPHDQIKPEAGYRVEVRNCFRCWRELHVYVPVEPQVALHGLVTGVSCPHCHQWEAETLIPDISKPTFVRACQRSEAEWLVHDLRRVLRIGVARVRVFVSWPYWAVYRVWLRVQYRRREKAMAKKP